MYTALKNDWYIKQCRHVSLEQCWRRGVVSKQTITKREHRSHDFIKPSSRTGNMNGGNRHQNKSYVGDGWWEWGTRDPSGWWSLLVLEGYAVIRACVNLLKHIKLVRFVFSASPTLKYSFYSGRFQSLFTAWVCSFPASLLPALEFSKGLGWLLELSWQQKKRSLLCT